MTAGAPAHPGLSLAVVVPTFDMAAHLEALIDSIEASGVADLMEEAIFVDDGSRDDTLAVLERRFGRARAPAKWRALPLGENRGRFVARLEGARASRARHLLFLDARVRVCDGFGDGLRALLPRHDSLMGTVEIDARASLFNLYWLRTHQRIFWRNFRDQERGFALRPDNFEEYVKGTTVLACARAPFIDVCEQLAGRPMFSDDTLLMKEMVKHDPIWVDARLKVAWAPRQELGAFLARLWERGPGFVEYHVIERRGAFFWVVVAGLAALVALAAAWIVAPPVGALLSVAALALAVGSTALFARTPVELARMAPLHVAVLAVYGAAVLRGLVVHARASVP